MSCLFPNWIRLLEGAIQAVSGPLNGLEVKSHYEVVLTLLAFASFSFSFVAMFLFYHGNLCVSIYLPASLQFGHLFVVECQHIEQLKRNLKLTCIM